MSTIQHPAPRVLLIEDLAIHARLARYVLSQAGFGEVIVKDTVLAGVEKAKRLLQTSRPYHPTMIVLDWRLPHEECPSLEANVAAAELIRAMDEGEIHPVHMVVLTFDPTSEGEQDALDAGCELVLAKPLDLAKAQQLRDLADRPRPAITDQARAAYKRLLRYTAPTLELLYGGRPTAAHVNWDSHAVKWLIMKAVSPHDMPEPGHAAWIEERGGLEAIRGYVRQVPISDVKLAEVRDVLLTHFGESQQFYAAQLGWSVASYHLLKGQLFEFLVDVLNTDPFDVKALDDTFSAEDRPLHIR